ncbi:MAG TPA: hypothetical protein VM100_04545, partial [Longimicrobiales bacterium]|nr:hypothetical protein [Longimicrobiales bacterium]
MKVTRDALYTTLRMIGRHVEGFYPPLAAFLSVGFAIAIVAMLIFSGVAHAVHEGITQSFDEAVLRWLYTHRSPTLDVVMLEITM